MSIHLTALVRSKPGKSADIKPLLLELVSASKKEEACLQYELYHSTEDENLFIFHEEWASEEDLQLHNTGEGISTFIKASAEVLDGPITIFKTDRVI